MTTAYPFRLAPRRGLPTATGGLLVVLASIAISAGSYGLLGEQLRIRWTVEPSYVVGPETVSTSPVLVAFPALIGVSYLGLRLLGARLAGLDGFEEVRFLYEFGVGLTLGLLLALQALLVVANLL